MHIFRFLLFVVFFSGCSIANADELNLTLGSTHFKHNGDMNNVNPGVGYIFDQSVLDEYFGWEPKGHDTVGFYLNSHNKWSMYVGYYRAFSIPEEWKGNSEFLHDIELGWMAGVALGGYDNCIHSMPAVLLVGTYPIGKLWGDAHWNARVTIAPIDSGVATLSLSYRF